MHLSFTIDFIYINVSYFLYITYKLYINSFFLFPFRFLMVFTCLALSVFSTIEEYEDQAILILLRMEILVVIWFTVEFVLR